MRRGQKAGGRCPYMLLHDMSNDSPDKNYVHFKILLAETRASG